MESELMTNECCLCWGENALECYDGLCERCYARQHHLKLDDGMGRCCEYCGDELRRNRWVAILNPGGKTEYCEECYDEICENEADEMEDVEFEETELEFRMRIGAIKKDE